MELETIRMVADWLEGAAPGSSNASVNAFLPSVPRDAGDDVPPNVTVYDSTRDEWVTLQKVPHESEVTLPALVVCPADALRMDGEVMTVFRDGRGKLAVVYVDRRADRKALNQNALYTARAVRQSLKAFHDPVNAGSRARNNIHLLNCEQIEELGIYKEWADAWASRVVMPEYRIRDLLPTGVPLIGDEIAYLRANIVGGDAPMKALYSRLFGITTSSGVVDQWDDARGGGFGPSLLSTGTQRPAWDSVNSLITFDGVDDFLASAASALFDLSGAKTLALIAALPSTTGPAFAAGIANDATASRHMGIRQEAGGASTIKGQLNRLGGNVAADSLVQISATRRLIIVSKTAGPTVRIKVPGQARQSATDSVSIVAGDNVLSIGGYFQANSPAKPIVCAALVLDREPTSNDDDVLLTWAETYHQAVAA